MKSENIQRFGRKGIWTVSLSWLAAGGLLTACVDEENLPYGSTQVAIEATPVKGQGLRLEAWVSNPELTVEKCGFRVDNGYVKEKHYPLYFPYLEEWPRTNVELPGQTSFSTLIKPQEEWMTEFVGYAYIVVNGKEYRSEVISAELGPNDMERHIPKVETVSIADVYASNGRAGGVFVVTGEGFYGFPSITGFPAYIQFRMEGGDFKFNYDERAMQLTPTRITLPFSANSFDKFNLYSIVQGGVEYPVNLPFKIIPDEHLVAPSYALRSGEFIYMHELLRSDTGYRQRVDSLEVDHGESVGVTNVESHAQGNLFAVLSDRDEVNCKQYIRKTPINEPLVIKMSYPWEEKGQLSPVPTLPVDRVLTAGAVWYVTDEALCRLDPKTGQETRYALPFHPTKNEIVCLGKDDKGGLLVGHNCNTKSGRDQIYAFNPASAQFESLGYVSPYSWFQSNGWELQFIGQEGNSVYLVHRISQWLHCFTRFDTSLHRVDARYLDDSPNSYVDWRVTGLHDGRIFVMLNRNFPYYVDLRGTNQSVGYTRISNLPISFDYGLFYQPEFIQQSGHYLYVGNAPVARYDLSKADFPKEYLGAPRGAYRDVELLTLDGDDCEVLDKKTGKRWRFVEDR